MFGVHSGDGQITWAAVQRWHRLLRHSEGEFQIFFSWSWLLAIGWKKVKTAEVGHQNSAAGLSACIMQSWSSPQLLYYVYGRWWAFSLQPSRLATMPAPGQTYIWSNINSSRLLNFSSNPQILTFKPAQRFKGAEGNIDGGCEKSVVIRPLYWKHALGPDIFLCRNCRNCTTRQAWRSGPLTPR